MTVPPPHDRRVDCRGGLPQSDKSLADWQNLSLNIAARSSRPGGVNVALADAHIQFIRNTISTAVWQALGTRAGGEVIGADQL